MRTRTTTPRRNQNPFCVLACRFCVGGSIFLRVHEAVLPVTRFEERGKIVPKTPVQLLERAVDESAEAAWMPRLCASQGVPHIRQFFCRQSDEAGVTHTVY